MGAFKIQNIPLSKSLARADLFAKNNGNWIGDYALEALYEQPLL